MGGGIWVESVEGKGSAFHFAASAGLGKVTEPPQAMVSVALAGSDALVVADNATNRTLPEGKKKLNVLLAEDNAVNQKLAARVLEKHGHRVTVTANGREALAALDREDYDVVLMDVQMPEMDGFEATAAIRVREQSTGGHLPIIAMTAHAIQGDKERRLAAGMDGYISKPIRAQQLVDLLSDFSKATEKESIQA